MEQTRQIDHAVSTRSMIRKFYAEAKYWDVQLQVGTKLFKCQRLLLAANSEYFDTMFSSNFKESDATRDQPITLHEMDASVFKDILEFIYSGEIRVKDSNVRQLLFANDFLRLRTSHVKEQCLEHVKSCSQRDNPMSNALELFFLVRMMGENEFVDVLSAHISEHLYYYSNDAPLMEISLENLEALLKFSNNYILPLRGSADVLVKIIHNWVDYDRGKRGEYVCKLLENIDLSNVSPEFSFSLIKKLENAVNEMKLCKNMKSLSKLKTSEMGIEIGVTSCDARLNATITFHVENLKEIPMGKTVYSSSCIISNLSWKIGILHKDDDFGVYLYCDGTNTTSVWNCCARVTIILVSCKEPKKNFVRELGHHMYSSVNVPCGWGHKSFLKWNYLIDVKNGYINDDDSITLDALVKADVPFRKKI